jgi:predicted nucleic-acid-binding protein
MEFCFLYGKTVLEDAFTNRTAHISRLTNNLKNHVLIVNDKNEIIRLKNQYISYKFDFTGQLNKLTAIKENANRLITVLKKNHLE